MENVQNGGKDYTDYKTNNNSIAYPFKEITANKASQSKNKKINDLFGHNYNPSFKK
jgi:hypothetical protein